MISVAVSSTTVVLLRRSLSLWQDDADELDFLADVTIGDDAIILQDAACMRLLDEIRWVLRTQQSNRVSVLEDTTEQTYELRAELKAKTIRFVDPASKREATFSRYEFLLELGRCMEKLWCLLCREIPELECLSVAKSLKWRLLHE